MPHHERISTRDTCIEYSINALTQEKPAFILTSIGDYPLLIPEEYRPRYHSRYSRVNLLFFPPPIELKAPVTHIRVDRNIGGML